MRTWTRAAGDTICGGPCGRQLRRGDPLLLIQVTELTRRHQRCAACAGEPAPADLPALVVHDTAAVFRPMVAIQAVSHNAAALPLDWKTRAANTREPGEDG